MDIVITVPKEEGALIQEMMCIEGKQVKIWRISKVPKQILTGEHVYFVDGGVVKYYYHFLGFIQDPICEQTKVMRRGLHLMLGSDKNMVSTKKTMPSFQGIRYIDRIY